LTEDDFIKGSSPAGGGSVEERIAAINKNPLLLDTSPEKYHERKALIAERDKLYAEAYGTGEKK
jgi:hypothetical protein